MKIIRILFAIISVIICTIASVRIDVNALTRGGWESSGAQQSCFFNRDDSDLAAGGSSASSTLPDGSVEEAEGGRNNRDKTWSPPRSPEQLAVQLYAKLWIVDACDKSIYFYQTDTCYVTDLRRQIVNDKYVWHALDSVTISLAQPRATLGHPARILKVKMLPGAFEVTENGTEDRYVHNANYDLEYLNTVLDMVDTAPAGCYNYSE